MYWFAKLVNCISVGTFDIWVSQSAAVIHRWEMHGKQIPVRETSVGIIVKMSLCVACMYFFPSYLQLPLSPPPAHYIIRHHSVFHLHTVIFLAQFLKDAYQNILNWLCLCAFCFLRPVAEALKASLLAIEGKKRLKMSNWDEKECYFILRKI